MTSFRNNNLYFAFVGSCKGYSVKEAEEFGKLLYNVSFSNGEVNIYESIHPKWVIVEERDENHENTEITFSLYMVRKNSFDCLSGGQELRDALS